MISQQVASFDTVLPLNLNRPEYMPVPEGFISAIAWSKFRSANDIDPTTWIRFRTKESSSSSSSGKILNTEPTTSQQLSAFQEALNNHGLQLRKDRPDEATQAILNSIQGLSVNASKTLPVSPLTPSLALLQNTRGLTSKGSPAAFDTIFERIFQYGVTPTVNPSYSVASLWYQAASKQMELFELLRILDQSIQANGVTPIGARVEKQDSSHLGEKVRDAKFNSQNTPMGWFADTWIKLTSTDWVEALPPRIWVDWATTVMRTALGFTYLWEAQYYRKLGEHLIRGDSFDKYDFSGRHLDGILVVSSHQSTSIRDVASFLKLQLRIGMTMRDKIIAHLNSSPQADLDARTFFTKSAKDSSLVKKLVEARQKPSEFRLVWEAITYSLQIRDSSRGEEDQYGMWRKIGNRFTVIEPATEWVAVVASLSSQKPGSTVSLAVFGQQLRRLGLRIETRETVTWLERSGMARGSDDADLGLQIETAF